MNTAPRTYPLQDYNLFLAISSEWIGRRAEIAMITFIVVYAFIAVVMSHYLTLQVLDDVHWINRAIVVVSFACMWPLTLIFLAWKQ